MAISIAARQRLVSGLWGGRLAGSFAGRGEVVVEEPSLATPGGPLFRDRKRRRKVIRYSDFKSREEYAKALASAIPMSQVRPYPTMERTPGEDEETEVIFMLLKMLH